MMNDFTQETTTYVIQGMDVSTHDCRNLSDFNHTLITGKRRSDAPENIQIYHRGLQRKPAQVKAGNHQVGFFLNQIVNSVKQTLLDGGIDDSHFGHVPISVVIHLPSAEFGHEQLEDIDPKEILKVINNEINLKLQRLEICEGAFIDAISMVTAQMREEPDGFVLLSSSFLYSNGKQDQDHLFGSGCILFSQKDNTGLGYARLMPVHPQDLIQQSVEADFPKLNNGYHCASIIKLIRSALELNRKTRYTHLRDNIPYEENTSHNSPPIKIRPWFSPQFGGKRENVLHIENYPEVTLGEISQSNLHQTNAFSQFGTFLFPVSFSNISQGIEEIENLKSKLLASWTLAEISNQYLEMYGEKNSEKLTLAVLGASKQEVIDELERSRSGIAGALENERDWQTPTGSFFTPNPLGPQTKISFVYPGAFSTYVGMGSELFYLFPQLYDILGSITSDPAGSINESMIFPPAHTDDEIEQCQAELNDHPVKMISSGVCFSFLYTVILRDIFKVMPDCAFGYSLGENSMMFGMGIWQQAEAMRTSLEVSPIFHSRVSGPQIAVRDYWNITDRVDSTEDQEFWANYVLMAPVEKVREAILKEDRVYLTHINTLRQVVIGGEKAACQRIADSLKCMHLQAPYHHAIHCAPIASEFEGFVHLHHWPVETTHNVPVYSAADYAPLEYESNSIANAFAKMLTNPIDFPRLVNLAHMNGARIFIELGAGSNCTKWVDAVLKGKPHAAMSINQMNVGDHLSILRLVARLICHRVPLTLDPIWKNGKD